eukprot:g18462.t1
MTLRATLKFKPEAGAPDINTDLPLPTGGGGLYTSVVVDSTGAISEDNLVAVTLALGNGFLDQENYLGAEVDKNRQKPDSSLQRKPQEATAAEWCTGVRQSDDGLDDTAPITTTSAAPAPAPAARHLAEKHKTVDKAVEVVDEDDSLSDCC